MQPLTSQKPVYISHGTIYSQAAKLHSFKDWDAPVNAANTEVKGYYQRTHFHDATDNFEAMFTASFAGMNLPKDARVVIVDISMVSPKLAEWILQVNSENRSGWPQLRYHI